MSDVGDSALIVSPEVYDLAVSILEEHVIPRDVARALVHDIAGALQVEVNRAELAELERRQAVDALRKRGEQFRALADQLKALATTTANVPWVACHRCGHRAATVGAIEHDEHCALSSRPPPRLSLVSPKREGDDAS